MSFINSIHYQLFIGKLREAEKRLHDAGDEKLSETLRQAFETYNNRKMSSDAVVCAGSDFYDGIAAAEILRQHRGQDYVLGIMGRRKPRSFRESVHRILTGEYPLLEETTG